VRERLLGGFYLGEHHVEPLTGLVSGPAGARRLHGKALELLLCLAARAPALVTRDELLRSGWGGIPADSEALSRAIGEIRHALGDSAAEQAFVQTLPKRGYRLLVRPAFEPPLQSAAARDAPRASFFGELKRRGVLETAVAYLVLAWLAIQVANATFTPLSLPAWALPFLTYLLIVGFPIALVLSWFLEMTARGLVIDRGGNMQAPAKRLRNSYVAIVGALALASVGVAAYDQYIGLPGKGANAPSSKGQRAIAVKPNTVAVLPFLSINGGEQARTFTDGLTEDVIDRLAKVPGLRVAARGDAFSLPPNARSQDVRRRLRVAYYLEGSVRLEDQGLRIVVQLVSSADGFHIFSRTFDRELKDFFSVQDEITSLTVASLRVALPSLDEAQIEPVPNSTNLDAYLLYRKGMAALRQPMTRATIAEALDAFNGALHVDRDYAAAHAGICMTYSGGYQVTSDAAYIDSAERACAEALALNGNLNVVHDALGNLYAGTGRYEGAESAYKRALAINPADVDALLGLGKVLNSQKRFTEAEARFRQAVGLQPGNWNAYHALGKFLAQHGRYTEAASEFGEIVSLDAKNATGWTLLAGSLMLSGDFSAAADSLRQAIALKPTATSYTNLGILHYYLGETAAAKAALQTAVNMAPQDYVIWSNLGDVLAVSHASRQAAAAFGKAESLAEAKLDVNNRDADTIADLAWIKAMLGKLDAAGQLVARAHEAAPGDPYVFYIDALIDVRRNRRVAGLDKLETASKMGYPLALIAAEPHLATLRGDSRFKRLVAKQM
jgi:TolB-like protein/Flp pilus assembly protein TadD/DNA-binding winged helix-turn-helix (wHTH) protein